MEEPDSTGYQRWCRRYLPEVPASEDISQAWQTSGGVSCGRFWTYFSIPLLTVARSFTRWGELFSYSPSHFLRFCFKDLWAAFFNFFCNLLRNFCFFHSFYPSILDEYRVPEAAMLASIYITVDQFARPIHFRAWLVCLSQSRGR